MSSKSITKTETKLSAFDKLVLSIESAETNAQHHANVVSALGIIKRDPGKASDALKAYMLKHGDLVHSAVDVAEQTAEQRKAEFAEVKSALEKKREDRDKALKLQSERVRDEVDYLYVMCVLTRSTTQRDMAKRWGVSEQWISNRIATAKNAVLVSATSAPDVAMLADARKKHSAALTRALNAPGATVKTVREAITDAKAEKDGKPLPSLKNEPAPAEIEAHTVLSRAAALLVQLNKNGTVVADKGEVTGESRVKALAAALDSYIRRVTAPDDARALVTDKATAKS